MVVLRVVSRVEQAVTRLPAGPDITGDGLQAGPIGSKLHGQVKVLSHLKVFAEGRESNCPVAMGVGDAGFQSDGTVEIAQGLFEQAERKTRRAQVVLDLRVVRIELNRLLEIFRGALREAELRQSQTALEEALRGIRRRPGVEFGIGRHALWNAGLAIVPLTVLRICHGPIVPQLSRGSGPFAFR